MLKELCIYTQIVSIMRYNVNGGIRYFCLFSDASNLGSLKAPHMKFRYVSINC